MEGKLSTLAQENTYATTQTSRRRLAWLPQRWYVHVVLILSCFIMGLPLIYAVLVSTQSNSQVFNYHFGFGDRLLDNLKTVLVDRRLGTYMLNSITMAVAIAATKTVFSLLAGLAFVYFRFPGKWFLFAFVLITLMMPTEVIFIGLFRFVSGLDIPPFAQVVFPFMASATGVFLFRQHFANIPTELSEAAQLDGASPLRFLFSILVPISWNTIGALTVVQFLYAWNMYLWPRMIAQNQENWVVQVGLRTLLAVDTGVSYGPLMLGAVIASLPPVIVFILLQKQFMNGFQLTRDK